MEKRTQLVCMWMSALIAPSSHHIQKAWISRQDQLDVKVESSATGRIAYCGIYKPLGLITNLFLKTSSGLFWLQNLDEPRYIRYIILISETGFKMSKLQ